MNSAFLTSFSGGPTHATRCEVPLHGATRRRPRLTAKRSRVGHTLLLQMLISGSVSNSRRQDVLSRSAAVEEQSPSVTPSIMNGAVEEWSGEPRSRDWDGRPLEGASQSLPAIAGLLAVAGAGYFMTKSVTTLFRHRSDLQRIVPHPVALTASESTSPRSSISDDAFLKGRPLSPDSIDGVKTEERGVSPVPYSVKLDRSTSMGSFGVESVREGEVEDDGISMTSAADAIDVESTISSVESSDLGSLEAKDEIISTRGRHFQHPDYADLSKNLVYRMPTEFTLGSLRERAELAMKAANAATEAAQKAAAYSAAASTASASAQRASSKAMSAAATAHIAMKSGNVEQMTDAQAEAWKAMQIASEAESRATEAAALASAYEDIAEQQSAMARELAKPPPGSFLREISKSVVAFFHPVTAAITGVTSAVYRWIMGVWNYFASGTCWRQICGFCGNTVAFVGGMVASMIAAIKNACSYIVSKVTGFCRNLFARIFHPKGSIGGEATA